MDTVEKSVLGFLILQPTLIKADGLSSCDFSGKAKTIFNAVADLCEETEGADITLLQNKLDGKIRPDEIADLVTGIPKTTPGNFSNLVRELKKKNLAKRIIYETNKMAKSGHFEIEKARKYLKAIEKIDATAPNVNKIKIENMADFLKREFPKRRILIDPIFGESEITMLHGRPKIGKSLLTLQLCRCLADGINFLDFKVNKTERPILILQSEVSPAMMQARCKKIFDGMENPEIIVIPELPKPCFFDEKDGRKNIQAIIEKIEPGLVFLDPYGKFFSSEELSLKESRPFFDFWAEAVEKFALSVFFVHHDAKFQENKYGGQKALGSTAINASTDGNWNIDRIVDADLKPEEFNRYARLSFESRNWPDMKPVDLQLQPDLSFEKTIIENKKLDEWGLLDLIENEGGQVEFKKLREMFSSNLRALYRAKERGIKEGLFDEAKMTGIRGQPVYLTIKNGDGETK
jgi:hypothetical protein